MRLYASGQPGGARSDRLLYQAKLALDESLRLKVVRKMYELRFGEKPPQRRSIEQLRGIEGARVRKTYQLLAQRHGVTWQEGGTTPKTGINPILRIDASVRLTHACMALPKQPFSPRGYAPAVGFIHTGEALSFVYDIADLFKFEGVVPIAFQIAARRPSQPDRAVRLACRDHFS